MDFLLWSARSLHIFSVVVWIGGLLFQSAVAFPVARSEQKELDPFSIHLLRRFQPFVWMCVWTIFVTGVALMLFNPRFILFHYPDLWSILLALKQLVFGLMVFFSFGYARMFRGVDGMIREGGPLENVQPFYSQMLKFGKINVGLAILALLLAAGLNS